MSKLIPEQALIYENANGVLYARYRDPPHNKIPRWVVGGHPQGFYPRTTIPLPVDWNYTRVDPAYELIDKNEKLRKKYIEFLEEQDKYLAWETMTQSQ